MNTRGNHAPPEDVLSHAVIEAIAAREGISVTEVEPPEFPPLYEVVNPEALDSLFAPISPGDGRGPGSVTFTYADYEVTVHSDGRVDIAE